jgi:thiosulfate dehydrogenase
MKISLIALLLPVACWASDDLNEIPGKTGAAIRYGYELLSETPKYFGPKGKVKTLTKSRMACRNCHIDVGRNPVGNSWLDSHGAYPQYRAREGMIQTLADRVNACMQFPMQGKPILAESEEMRSILLYMKWIGKGRPSVDKDMDQRLVPLAFLNRAANPSRGKDVYQNYCVSCHGLNGEGKLNDDKIAFKYPPLWGNESYIVGSSMSRLSLLARFIKGTMPQNTTKDKPVLSDEDAWDVAAFVNTQKRPSWKFASPFKSVEEKPFDYPIGPFADSFKPEQHQLGPFQEILDFWKAKQGSRAQDTMGI